MNRWPKIAIVDDDPTVRDSLSQMLNLRNYETMTFERGEKLLESDALHKFSCFVIDVRMPGISGLELLKEISKKKSRGPVVMITGHGDIATAVEAMKKGAYDFQEKPFEKSSILASIARAVEKAELIHTTRRLQKQIEIIFREKDESWGILGTSPQTQEVKKQIKDYAPIESSILVMGETGTGKELVAKALHEASDRKNKNFVALNMAALPESIIHSELFGHEKGAFTGAANIHQGKFEYASGGTIFLDEIDSLPIHLQAILLRVLEEKMVTRLGSNQQIPVDVRVVAATNQDIQKLIEEGKFRRDLFHRLGMLSIQLPPLRKRPEDIPVLVHHFLQEACILYRKGDIVISPLVIQKMQTQLWPGNIRELKNEVEALVIRCQGREISQWGDMKSVSSTESIGELADQPMQSLRDATVAFETQFISHVLREVKGNLKLATEVLDVSPRTLFDKMKKLDLKKEDFK